MVAACSCTEKSMMCRARRCKNVEYREYNGAIVIGSEVDRRTGASECPVFNPTQGVDQCLKQFANVVKMFIYDRE